MLALHEPQRLIDPMDAPVAELTVGIIEEMAVAERVNLLVEGPQRRRPAPHVPVHPRWRLAVRLRLFWSAAAGVYEALDRPDLADLSGSDELACRDIVWRHSAVGPHLDNAIRFACGF